MHPQLNWVSISAADKPSCREERETWTGCTLQPAAPVASDEPPPDHLPGFAADTVTASVERISPAEGWAIVRVTWPDGRSVLVRASRTASTWQSPVTSLAERLRNLAAATEVIADIVAPWQRDEYARQADLLFQAAVELRGG